MINVKVNSAALDRQLDSLKDNVKRRQKMARKLADEVRKLSVKNVKQQIKIEGSPFAKRKKARLKRRLLIGLGKLMKVSSRASSGGGAAVGWKNSLTGQIAYRHQHGVPEDWTPQKLAKEKRNSDPAHSQPCTPKQARALLKEGYKRAYHNKNGKVMLKRVSAAWLQENMKAGQAGLILRALRTGSTKGKQKWTVEVAPRTFLGVNETQTKELLETASRQILKFVK